MNSTRFRTLQQVFLGFCDCLFQSLKFNIGRFGSLLDQSTQSSSHIVLDYVVKVAAMSLLTIQLREINRAPRRVQLVRKVILSVDSTSWQKCLLSIERVDQSICAKIWEREAIEN